MTLRYNKFDKGKNAPSVEIGSASSRSVQRSGSDKAAVLDDRTYVRPPYDRSTYERFRPGDRLPIKAAEIMRSCRDSYEKVGIIRSVIDLMTELAIEGMELISENESTQNFYQSWAKRVNLENRAEAFVNYALVEGNIVVRRMMGDLDTPEMRRMRLTTNAQSENDIEPGLVPLDYVFYDPSTIELIGEEVAALSTEKQWGLKISAKNLQRILSIGGKATDTFISTLPEELKQFIRNNGQNTSQTLNGEIVIPIPSNRLYIAHYKKRDTDVWAKSFIYSILHDVIYNEKLRVAKIATLDSWNNSTKIWKIGDHKEGILPTRETYAELAATLQNNQGAGDQTIIWDSLISYEEHYPPIEKLDTFEENFESILVGLGVHRSLIGGSESSGAAATAFVGLRNMMKRIDAVRRILKHWIETEIDIISENMGFRTKPQIVFSLTNLFDQTSYFKLLTELVDRDIMSDHTVLERIGEAPNIEKYRVKKENDKRGSEMPDKKGQFMQPGIPEDNFDKDKQKLKLQHQNSLEQIAAKPKPKPPGGVIRKKPKGKQGRKAGSKDTVKRKRTYRSKAEALITASKIQSKLDLIFDKAYLVYNHVDNKRQLTAEDRSTLETSKISILACFDDDSFETIEQVEELMNSTDPSTLNEFNSRFQDYLKNAGDQLTLENRRAVAALVYSEIFEEEEENNVEG